MPNINLGVFGQSINNGMFTMPNIYNPTALLGQAPSDDIKAENAQMFTPYIDPFELKDNVTSAFSFDSFEFSKKLSLIVIAGLLLGFGLYLLAKDTETFKLAVDATKTVATRGAM